MPTTDFNGESLFQGVQNAFYAGEDTSELFLNNADTIGVVVIFVLFFAIAFFTIFVLRYIFKKQFG